MLLAGASLLLSAATAVTAQLPAPTRQYDVAPAPLATVLLRFAEQANVQFSVDASLTSGKESRGVKGAYTLDAAMRMLLADSGLVFRFAGPMTIVIERSPRAALVPADAVQ